MLTTRKPQLEYLWKAAYALYPEAAEQREGWVMDRARAVLQGRALDVAVGLRRAATRKQLSQRQREPIDKAADYIDNNRERLQYDQALEPVYKPQCRGWQARQTNAVLVHPRWDDPWGSYQNGRKGALRNRYE